MKPPHPLPQAPALVTLSGAPRLARARAAAAALGSGYSRLVLELSLALRGLVPPHWSVDAAWTALERTRDASEEEEVEEEAVP